MSLPTHVRIVEVGPRDGLQNETNNIPTQVKIELINRLSQSGLSCIEATSFVSPKWIPQLSDHSEVFLGIEKNPQVSYPVLVPNLKGLESALAVGVKEIAVFTTPSESFSTKNMGCSVKESLERIEKVMLVAQKHQIKVRGYLSCVLGCPYEGEMAPERVALLSERLSDLGCTEISLGDTIGVGTPISTKRLIESVSAKVSIKNLAVHFHDTYGLALVNIYVALQQGISVIDSSIAGLGGCPYAKGASGNVATEDVVYFLQRLGIETGVDLAKIIVIGKFISNQLGKTVRSKVSEVFESHSLKLPR